MNIKNIKTILSYLFMDIAAGIFMGLLYPIALIENLINSKGDRFQIIFTFILIVASTSLMAFIINLNKIGLLLSIIISYFLNWILFSVSNSTTKSGKL